MENKNKRTGGAARERDKKKKLLLAAAATCHNIGTMFSKTQLKTYSKFMNILTRK